MRLPIKGEYPANRPELHDAVRAEAGNRCIRCGHPAEGIKRRSACDVTCSHPDDGKPRVLTVHHLDGDKSNSRWWNLLALCQVCHLTVQGRVIPERMYLWEHTPWFKPFVAGFYAFIYGQQEITREEAEAELDTWLRLGQPWLYEAIPTASPTGKASVSLPSRRDPEGGTT